MTFFETGRAVTIMTTFVPSETRQNGVGRSACNWEQSPFRVKDLENLANVDVHFQFCHFSRNRPGTSM